MEVTRTCPILLPHFPIVLDSGGYGNVSWSPPLLADFNNDGMLEIVITEAHAPPPTQRAIHIITQDGKNLQHWPKKLHYTTFAKVAAGDVNNDGNMDIVLLADSLFVFSKDAELFPGFPVAINNGVDPNATSLVIYDLDGDGQLEMITCSGHKLIVINSNGQIREGWLKYYAGIEINKPAVGDIIMMGLQKLFYTRTNG